MDSQVYNPIYSIDGEPVYCPSKYQWDLQDVSNSEAGRTEDGKMWKNRIGQCRKISLEWSYTDWATTSYILKLFQKQYLKVKFLDALVGDYIEREMYVGDRTVPMYNCNLGLWEKISFNLIERLTVPVESDKQDAVG